MSQSTEQLILEILADNKQARKAIGEIIEDHNKLGKHSGGMFSQLKMGWLAVTAVITGVVLALKGFVNAQIESQKANSGLRSALRDTGNLTNENYKALQNYATELQKAGIAEDDHAKSLMARALNMGISYDKVKEATQGAIGLSQKFKDLDQETAIKGIANAYNGNFESLQRYIPALRTTTDESRKLAMVKEYMAAGFKQAQDATTTFGGKLQKLGLIAGEAQEDLGKGLIKALDPIIADIDKFVSSAEGMEKIKTVIKVVSTAFVIAGALIGGSIKSIISWISLIVDNIKLAGGAISKTVKGDWVGAWKDVQGIVIRTYDAGKDQLNIYTDVIKTSAKGIVDIWTETDEEIVTADNDKTNKLLANQQTLSTEAALKKTEEYEKQLELNDMLNELDQVALAEKQMHFVALNDAERLALLQSYQINKGMTDKIKQEFGSAVNEMAGDWSSKIVGAVRSGSDIMKINFGVAIADMIAKVAELILQMTILKGIMGALNLFSPGLGTGLGKLLGLASGTDSAPGGPAIVGEKGPELMYVPRGAQIIPNNMLNFNVPIPRYAEGVGNSGEVNAGGVIDKSIHLNFPDAVVVDENSIKPLVKIFKRVGDKIDDLNETY